MRRFRPAVWFVSLAACGSVFGFAGAISGLELSRHLAAQASFVSVAAVSDRERLQQNILDYVVERNPSASLRAFRDFPAVLVDEAARTGIDHCLALAQAQAESDFRPDAVGAAGEIGLYQILPSTAALLEPLVGRFRRPVLRRVEHDLGDLADPIVSTRFAMAYLRDILTRKASVRDALIEYNGGPRQRQPHYYRVVMATYVELLERPALSCRFREMSPPKSPMIAFVR